MAKQQRRKGIPPRKSARSHDEDALLRSAELLGRVIDALQRQLRGVRLSHGEAAPVTRATRKKESRTRAARPKSSSSARKQTSSDKKRPRTKK